jgi:hypothetical protein
LKGRGFSRAVSRLFTPTALAAEGVNAGQNEFFSSLFSRAANPYSMRSVFEIGKTKVDQKNL